MGMRPVVESRPRPRAMGRLFRLQEQE